MARKIEKLTRITRERKLTPEEAARARKARESADREAPQVIAKHRTQQAVARLAEALKGSRESKQMTLQQVADKSGMDVSNVAKIENGQRENPTLDTLFRIAAALGKDVELTLVDK